MTPDLTKLPELELRDVNPKPQTYDELLDIVKQLAEREHDYGTCVYAMSIAALAAFNFIAHKLGVTGFQASCADMDILRHSRGMKDGFRIVDYNQLLYPQYAEHLTMSPASLLADPPTRKRIREEAKKRMLVYAGAPAHPDVLAHWKHLTELPTLAGEDK